MGSKTLGQSVTSYVKSIPNAIKNATADLLENSDFISRNIGMSNSYEDIMSLVQGLGREPISLLGKDYMFIFDHVRRNYKQGTSVMRSEYNSVGGSDDGNGYGCTKFTFYKEKPTVKFANVDADPLNLLSRWVPNVEFESNGFGKTQKYYAESNDGETNNKEIDLKSDVDGANPGIDYGDQIVSYSNSLSTCDMIRKTNDNFNHGKYQTLIARFHTNDLSSKDKEDMTQTAISSEYGMSHGRNLMKRTPTVENGYDNPYCRVWTYHHQYNQLARAIRPFGDEEDTARKLEEAMSNGNTASNGEKFVSFRTTEDKKFGFKGGSDRLDAYGSLNYSNGLVNIAPTAKVIDYFEKKEDKKISVKKCMFSIENLAWKSDNIVHNEYDEYGLSAEQKGPLGGRIMWFPPYGLSFHENVTVNWNKNDFIGRGESVYTYTNTERSGNISFILLVDHPSILDYWTGRDVDKPTNNGISLTKGDASDPTTIDNQENTLLRFFAGCDVLTAKPQRWIKKKPKKKVVEDVKKDPEPEVAPKPTKKVLHCVLYYPNNYSGADDAPINGGGTVNAVHYLMNGVGAQKRINSNLGAEDIPTTIDVIPTIYKEGSNGESTDYGGYEKGKLGISITSKPLDANYSTIEKTYADLSSKARKGQYLTDNTAKKAYCRYSSNGGKIPLAKYIGSQALSLSAAKVSKNLNGKPHEWYRRRWYYRVDKAYQNDRLSTKESYLDINSYGLNSNLGYKKLLEYGSIASAFGLDSTDENTKLVSFADMFAALETNANSEIYNGVIDEDNVSLIRDIVTNTDKYNITSIEFQGHASYQGYAKKNTTLSSNRAMTFKKWMQSCGFPKIENATSGVRRQNNKDNADKGYNSSIVTKMWRSASVIIEYEESEIASVNSTTSSSENVSKIEVPNSQSSLNLLNSSARVDTSSMSNNSWQKNFGDTFNQTLQQREIMKDALRKSEEANTERINRTIDQNQSGTVERYDNEGEFFEMLGREDPFMHNLISEKIKYFDPAFHSISPEGFNARLNFLHQCTRQGSTVDASNGSAKSTAYNLSFGRPPVCVLRLGDFYYTKIIINSMSIQYDDTQWDLNPEGIGVMPVFAKIELNFMFLGGSDLAGPISRLQNAVSFNYYANTGVYDNRAEMVQYDSDGNGKEVAFKPYSYPDMLHKSEGIGSTSNPTAYGETPTIEDFNNNPNSKAVGKNYVSGEKITYQN